VKATPEFDREEKEAGRRCAIAAFVPLSALRAGAKATVTLRQMPKEEGEFLAALGLTDRCALRVCRAGEPCIIQVAATRLALSRSIARCVFVQPQPAPATA
jgi:Fe2+ transport system protein FeoA